MSTLLVDDRYRGAHGIGRYASEVLARLRPDWQPLGLDGSPYSPVDSLRRVPAAGSSSVVYSPGYAALVRAPRQILTVHDLIQLHSPWPGRAKFAAYYAGPVRHVVRKAGVVLTVSETSADAIRSWLRDDSVRVVNAGNGCSAAFRPEGTRADSTAAYVMYVGNTRHHKNIDVALRALALVPDLRLCAVLPQAEFEQARSRAAAAGVAKRVELISGIDDDELARLYRGAVATVMPSLLEGFGLPALESIACGTPVLYWQGCASVAEIVGEHGWALPDAHDATAWAAALTSAVDKPRRISASLDLYDWSRTADIISTELERAL